MRHLKSGRKLNRSASHRAALMRSLTIALLDKERIITTVAKAKELRGYVERLITLAKKNTVHARRIVVSRLHNKDAMRKLFEKIAPRFMERPGGYTRVIKRSKVRLGDAGPTAFIELIKEGETKAPKASPAPKVTPETKPEEAKA